MRVEAVEMANKKTTTRYFAVSAVCVSACVLTLREYVCNAKATVALKKQNGHFQLWELASLEMTKHVFNTYENVSVNRSKNQSSDHPSI